VTVPEGFRIRVLGPEDLDEILAADVFDEAAEPAATRRFLGQVGAGDPRNILVSAERDGRILGFASGTVLDHPDKARNLFIQELGVNEEARRLGLARALLDCLRAEGRARGCEVSWVLTEGDNEAAQATYRAIGGNETTGVVMYEWNEDPASKQA
jgi:ribosomal protein S18 acetylase RimI-like enzyme